MSPAMGGQKAGGAAGAPEEVAGVLPPAGQKAAVVRRMFGAIAPRYDLLNHLLSLNRDRAWRRRAVDLLLEGREPAGVYLDACAGTLDLAVELAARPVFRGTVLAADFTWEMLDGGRTKVAGRPLWPVCGDALRLPVRDASFDGATVGFGVRNLASLEAGLAELARVVRPGGRVVVLEFATPRRQPLRGLYLFYFRRLLPWIGRLVSRHGSAYTYLPASVLAFPAPDRLAELMRRAGFGVVRWESRTAGIVALHVGERVATDDAADQGTATLS